MSIVKLTYFELIANGVEKCSIKHELTYVVVFVTVIGHPQNECS